jgi:hypothetical protein
MALASAGTAASGAVILISRAAMLPQEKFRVICRATGVILCRSWSWAFAAGSTQSGSHMPSRYQYRLAAFHQNKYGSDYVGIGE